MKLIYRATLYFLFSWMIIIQISAQNPTSLVDCKVYVCSQTVILLDESNSMYERTDPQDVRGVAVRRYLDFLWAEQLNNADHLVAVLIFGEQENTTFISGTPSNPFIRINDPAQREELIRALGKPSEVGSRRANLTWTDTAHALELAEQALVGNFNPLYRPGIVVFTDGVPQPLNFEPQKRGEAERRVVSDAVLAQATDFTLPNFANYEGPCQRRPEQGAAVMSIVFDAAASEFTFDSLGLWDSISRDTFSPPLINVRNDNPSEQRLQMLQGFTPVLSEVLCRGFTTNAPVYVSGELTDHFSVSEYYDSIFFTVERPNRTVEVRLTRPDQSAVLAGPSNVIIVEREDYVIYTIRKPDRTDPQAWQGDWTLQLTGNGQVTFSFTTLQNARLVLRGATSRNPTGSPLSLEVTVTGRDGVTLIDQIPVSSEINITVYDDRTREVLYSGAVERQDNARLWEVVIPGEVLNKSENIYDIEFQTTIGITPNEAEVKNSFRVTTTSDLWFQVSPSVNDSLLCNPASDEISFSGQFMRGQNPANAVDVVGVGGTISDIPNSVNNITFTPLQEGQYRLSTTCNNLQPGQIFLTLFTASSPNLLSREFTLAVPTPTPSQTPLPTHTATATHTPTLTPTWTITPTSTQTAVPTFTLTPVPTTVPPVVQPLTLADLAPFFTGVAVLLTIAIGILLFLQWYNITPLNHTLITPNPEGEVYEDFNGRRAREFTIYGDDGSIAIMKLIPKRGKIDLQVNDISSVNDRAMVLIDGVAKFINDIHALNDERTSIVIGGKIYQLQSHSGNSLQSDQEQ